MRLIAPLLATLLAGCAALPTQAAPPPTAATASAPTYKPGGMVAAANPLAVEAGLRVLRDGGTAVDAAVAVQAVLGLVEPQSSGLGGGSFMVFYDAKTGKVTAYDGREKAPQAAGPDLFLGPNGEPLNFVTAVLSGRSTGVTARAGEPRHWPGVSTASRASPATSGCRRHPSHPRVSMPASRQPGACTSTGSPMRPGPGIRSNATTPSGIPRFSMPIA